MKRWIALIASIIMQTSLGMVYAWSTFVPALEKEHGIDHGSAGMIFGLCIATFTFSMIFGGMLLRKSGPRLTGTIGGLLFLAGYLCGALSDGNGIIMFLGFGVIAGIGIGFAYVCPLTTGVLWFPDHKGLITGLAVAGFGLGGVFFAKAGLHMLNAQIPVLNILEHIGILVGVTVVCCSMFLFVPARQDAEKSGERSKINLRKVIVRPEFQALFAQMFLGTFGGLLVIGNLKPIGLANSLSAETATRAVMLFAVGNAAGRVLWGLWYDRFGKNVIIVCMLLLAIGGAMMGTLPGIGGFYSATLITAFAFGGCFVMFAARVADVFGLNRIGDIYPLIFLGYGIAGLAGSPIGGWMLHLTGVPLYPCLLVFVLAIAGGAISVFSIIRKDQKSEIISTLNNMEYVELNKENQCEQ